MLDPGQPACLFEPNVDREANAAGREEWVQLRLSVGQRGEPAQPGEDCMGVTHYSIHILTGVDRPELAAEQGLIDERDEVGYRRQ